MTAHVKADEDMVANGQRMRVLTCLRDKGSASTAEAGALLRAHLFLANASKWEALALHHLRALEHGGYVLRGPTVRGVETWGPVDRTQPGARSPDVEAT